MSRTTRGGSGFTLIELMIVIAIVGIIAAIAVPNLIQARKGANETAAIGSLKSVFTAQAMYRSKYPHYAGEIPPLRGLLDDTITTYDPNNVFGSGGGQRSGYWFGIVTNSADHWAGMAVPVVVGRSGDRFFYVDETGVLRYTTTLNFSDPQPTDAEMRAWAPIGG